MDRDVARAAAGRLSASLDGHRLVDLGEQLRSRREALGWSMAVSARACTLSEKQLAAIEAGSRAPFYSDRLADTATRRYAALLELDLSQYEAPAGQGPCRTDAPPRQGFGPGTQALVAGAAAVLLVAGLSVFGRGA